MSLSDPMSDETTTHPTDLVRRSHGRWTPADLAELARANFRPAVRGFDRDEVRATIEGLTADYQMLLQENASLQKQIAGLEKTLADYRRDEQTFRSAIMTLQQQYDEVKRRAEQEAGQKLQHAREEADRLLAEARGRARKVEGYVRLLQQHQTRFYAVVERAVADLRTMNAGTPLLELDPATPPVGQQPPATADRPPRAAAPPREEAAAPPEGLPPAAHAAPPPPAPDREPAVPIAEAGNHRAAVQQRMSLIKAIDPRRFTPAEPPAAPQRNGEDRDAQEESTTVEQIESMLRGIDFVLGDIPALPAE